MARYELLYKASVARDLKGLPKADIRRILSRAEKLRESPFPPDCTKLAGQESYRIRQANYRILYTVDALRIVVFVVKVAHRKDVYRR
jgi:mRNA interferase RelE/StbE